MLGLAVLVQLLSIWAAACHAFYPWFPGCPDDAPCDHKGIGSDPAGVLGSSPRTGKGVAFKLTQRAASNTEPLEVKVARAAAHLSTKYARLGRSRAVLGRHAAELKDRDNTFSIVTAAVPKPTNAVGVAQEGADFSYFIQMGFGSGPKPLWMLFDTGAGTTWVMGTACQSPACTMHTTYGPSDSKTFRQSAEPFTITYGSGAVAGSVGSDSISVAGLTATMAFGVANVTSNDFTHFPFDGIIGMSLAKAEPNTDNFVMALQKQKLLASNVFAVSLNRDVDGPNTGEIMFGATDPAQFTGNIAYTPVSNQGLGDWAIPMDDIMYNGAKAGVTGRLAYIDTGTTYVFGPPADVAALHRQIHGAQSTDNVTYTVPCTSNQPLGVSFSGVTYAISTKDWLSSPNSSQVCRSNVYGREVIEGSWLLGDVFLKNVYAVFDTDQSRIGFAVKAPLPSPATPSTPAATGSSSFPSLVPITPRPQTAPAGSTAPGPGGLGSSGTASAETASPTSSHSSSPGERLERSRLIASIAMMAAFAVAF